MRISNQLCRACLACAAVMPLYADELTLSGGAESLSGVVRSIDAKGRVELVSPHSPEPMILKGGVVEKVDFGTTSEVQPSTALVELANGDLIPSTIEGLDDAKLTVTSPVLGRLEIPRDSLGSLQLGVQGRKLLYSGPRSLEDWSGEGGDMKNWLFERRSLIASGAAAASKKVNLPQKFILRFTLKWQARLMPNFQVYFADPLVEKGEPCDRYYLQFNGAGLEIKREASKGDRYKSIFLLNRTPNQFADHKLDVEIRVDRKGSRLWLFLNGEPEGVRVDPVSSEPVGSGITLVCNSQNGATQEITGIEILDFDDASVRHRTEERGDSKHDSLISREDDRWGGRLLEIRKAGEDSTFRFKSDFQNDPLEISGKDVSTVFFAGKEAAKPDENANPFVLRLRGEGSLRVSSCQFSADSVTAIHPLLGSLTLKRDGIASMERAASKPKPES